MFSDNEIVSIMGDQRIVIDLMNDEDNQAILDLSHRCPQKGVIEGYPDRSPEFRRIHQQISSKSYHMVARKGDRLIGAFGAVFTNLQYENQNFDAAYLMDLKVDPEYQRSTVAYRVVKETVSKLLAMDNKLTIATFLKNNQYSLIFTKARAGIPEAKYLGDFRIFSIVPLFKKKLSKKFIIGHPTEDDIPELVQLYNKYYSGFKLAPRMTEELLRKYTSEIDGMDFSQIWVARKNEKIASVICAWDEDRYKRWYVTRINRMMKFLSILLRVFGLFMKMPAPILENNSFKHIALVLSAHDDCIAGMQDLLRSVNNFYRGKEYTILQTHFHKDDPVNVATKGLQGFVVHGEIHLFTPDTNVAKQIAEDDGLVHFEWPMYI